jgi:hypothetical protein
VCAGCQCVGLETETVADANGNLRVPADYRTVYQFLGSWAVAAEQGQGSKEMHVVYASPGTISAYRQDGQFPDGSVLVKEVFETTTGAMTTGNVSHAKTLKGWFVIMKDRKNYKTCSRDEAAELAAIYRLTATKPQSWLLFTALPARALCARA